MVSSSLDITGMIPLAQWHLLALQRVILLKDKASWVRLPEGDKEVFDTYGKESLVEWHKEAGAFVE